MFGETLNERCRKCGQPVSDCRCSQFQAAAAWPNLDSRTRSEVEMTAKFIQLKQAGTGTIFIQAPSEVNQSSSTFIGLAPDAIIGGVYQIVNLVGRGGMGEVYLATHLTLNKKCALKVIPPDEVTEVGWQRFQLEAKTVSRLEHVNLVRVTDLGIHEECLPFYAMEYIEGRNLAEELAENGPMPLNKALDIFIQVCDGVDCAHRSGVLHRDLKPANIMLTPSASGKMEVKILDFGLAKLTKHDRFKQSLTGSGDVFGSPCYMSPEQCGDGELDCRSDIYSIGCTLFECLTGRPPFTGHLAAAVFFGHLEAEPPTLEKTVGPGKFPLLMEAVVARLLRKKPDQRYQTLSQVKTDLEFVARSQDDQPERSGEDILAAVKKGPQAQSPELTLAHPSRSRTKLWLAMALVAFVGLVGICYYQFSSRPPAGDGSDHGLRPAPEKATIVLKPQTPGSSDALASAGSQGPGAGDRQPADKDGGWDGRPFYTGLALHDGKQCQHWQYLGRRPPPIYLVFSEGGALQEARLSGDVYVPATARICAMPKLALIVPPPLVNGLAGGNFDEVDYEWYRWTDVKAANPAFAGCQSIKGLRIGNTEWSEEDCRASVRAINQFPHLERLILGSFCDGATLAEIVRLKALKEIRLNSGRIHLHDCLKAIDGSKSLLFLAALNWSGPTSDLEKVAKCANLQRLMIGQLPGSHEQFMFLARLNKLQQLELPALRYRPDLSADLRLLKSLKTLRFFMNSSWTDMQLSQLRADLPQVKVDTYPSLTDLREAFWLL